MEDPTTFINRKIGFLTLFFLLVKHSQNWCKERSKPRPKPGTGGRPKGSTQNIQVDFEEDYNDKILSYEDFIASHMSDLH